MRDRVELLVDILLDSKARDDERDDAALDLGQFDDDRALNALIQIATDKSLQEDFFIDVCGESIANILIKRDDSDLFIRIFEQLTPFAKHAAGAFVRKERPGWLK